MHGLHETGVHAMRSDGPRYHIRVGGLSRRWWKGNGGDCNERK